MQPPPGGDRAGAWRLHHVPGERDRRHHRLQLGVLPMKIQRIRQFLAALNRGARMHMRHGMAPGRALVSLLASFFQRGGVKVPARLYRARLEACTRCPLRDAELWTCGDGKSLMTLGDGRLVPAGCQCWLPLKAGIPKADCFLTEIGLPSRWP